jgi:spore maturation protein CgeB
MIDNIRPDFHILNTTIPFVCWVQDWLPRLFREEYIKKLSKRDFTYAITPFIRNKCLESGYKYVDLLPAAVNPKIYNPSEGGKREFLCDVAFIGNHVEKFPDDPIAEWLKKKYFEGVLKIERKACEDSIAEYIKEACRELKIHLPDEDLFKLGKAYFAYLIRPLQRIKILQWAKELGVKVKIWGKFWEKCPELAECAMGPVRNRSRELKEIYQSSKVCLHIHHEFSFHFRIPEIIASGGFVMVNALCHDFDAGGLNDHLKIGEEVITFNSKEDFQQKLLFFLHHGEEREAIVEAGRRRILKDHTYLQRAKKIIEDIGMKS